MPAGISLQIALPGALPQIRRRAPRDFVQAIACLMDDRIAEKAYEVIFKCRRGERL